MEEKRDFPSSKTKENNWEWDMRTICEKLKTYNGTTIKIRL